MSGIAILRRLLMKQAMKESAPFQHEGIMSISKTLSGNVDAKIKRWVESAKRQGGDIDKMSEQEIKYLIELNKPKGPTIGGHEVIGPGDPRHEGITRDLFNMLDRQMDIPGKNVIKADFGGGITDSVTETITKIKTMEPMDAMKEANKVLKGEGRYKSLSKADREKIVNDESVTDHIFERNVDVDPEDFAQGGRSGTGLNYLLGEDDQNVRVPFGIGGMSKARRAFLKMMGAGAAGVGAAKSGLFSLLKGGATKSVIAPATHAANQIITTAGMPAWFKPLVNKVIKEGTDISSKASTIERQIVHKSQLPNSKTDVYVNQDLDTGDVVVEIGWGKHGWADGHLGQPVRLEYRASEVIEPENMMKAEGRWSDGKPTGPGKKTKEEFWVEEAEFTGGHPENIKFEESSFNKFGEHGSNFDEVEKFATGKVKKSKPTKKAERTEYESGKAEADAERWTDEAQDRSHWVDDRVPEADDFASGGRVPLAEGTTPSDTQLEQYYRNLEEEKKRRRLQKQLYEQRFGGPGPVLEAASGGLAGMLGE